MQMCLCLFVGTRGYRAVNLNNLAIITDRIFQDFLFRMQGLCKVQCSSSAAQNEQGRVFMFVFVHTQFFEL